jgi:RHS repeat-associated protein
MQIGYGYGAPLRWGYKFTGKERDSESGLDNFGKRYNASSLGRFMTSDPIGIMKQKLRDPQQWNIYVYARNNPLAYLDPTGMYTWAVNCEEKKGSGCKQQRDQFRKGLTELNNAAKKFKEGTKERARLDRAIATIGEENKAGPSVAFADLHSKFANATTSPDGSTITVDPSTAANKNAKTAAGVIAEEGTHSADDRDSRRGSLSPFSFEYRGHQSYAWAVRGAMGQSGGLDIWTSKLDRPLTVWNPSGNIGESDADLTKEVQDDYGYQETTPHDPWDQ